MRKSSAFAVLLLAMLAVQQLAVQADIECSDVLSGLSPCLGFVEGDVDHPSSECCDGVTTTYAAADTTTDRQAMCECLKSAYDRVNADLSAAQALPADCGLSLSYTISPDFDCSTIE
ncbi:non-specific lipid-transfer protein 1-like [Phragmites australis]|uniref:non-specific lipid-transfer protein 1-like n=1 Tax=Phragmites australis TaxID=29695 RepID=UPI002D7651ED|nr:non-specific lipid-transfer protein 1-like [Phragmites australis]